MDVEGPPPFSGTFEEPLDTSGHRIPLGDDEDDSNTSNFELDIPIPNDISFQIPSPIPPVKKDNPSAPSLKIEQIKEEDKPISNGIHQNGNKDEDVKEDINIERPPCPPKLAENIASYDENNIADIQEESHECIEISVSEVFEQQPEDKSTLTPLSNEEPVEMETLPENGLENDAHSDFDDFSHNLAATASVSQPIPETSTDCTPPVEETQTTSDDFAEDDFGDFADFAPVNAATTSVDDGDEWGDFDAAPRTSRQASVRQDSVDDDDGFGAFGTVPSAAPAADEPEDDWAADFQQASVPVQPAEPTVTEREFPNLENMEISSVWDLYADEDQEDDCENAVHITAEFDCDTVEDTKLDSEDVFYKSAKLWHSLRIVEDTLALTFEWERSTMNRNYLKYLEIDQNVTPKAMAPLSVSSVLVPTPASLSAGSMSISRTTENNSFPSSSMLNPTVSSEGSNKENGSASVSPLRATTPECSSSTINIDSLSAPPADFDWNTSGLTNPLKGGSRNSALLDVDFLSLNSGTAVNSISTLQRDLDAFGLSSPSTSDNNSSQPSVLDKIMANTAAATTQKHNYKQSSELSLDASALHARLPEIGYLRSKNIMFPIGVANRPEQQ